MIHEVKQNAAKNDENEVLDPILLFGFEQTGGRCKNRKGVEAIPNPNPTLIDQAGANHQKILSKTQNQRK